MNEINALPDVADKLDRMEAKLNRLTASAIIIAASSLCGAAALIAIAVRIYGG